MNKIVAKLFVGVIVAGMLLTGCGKSEEEKALLEMPVERAEDILVKVWGCYDEEDKFSVIGGDSDSMAMGIPCEFNLEQTTEMESVLGVPEEAIALLDNAASLVDETNSNYFTAGAFQLANAKDVKNFTSLVKDYIMEKDWGEESPDELIIATLDETYVIVAFGEALRMEVFEEELEYATDASIIIETDWK